MNQFHVREYELLKQEVLSYVSESRQLEKAAVGAAAAVYAWLATHSADVSGVWLVWFVPTALAVLGGIRAIAIGKHIDTIAEYLRELEEQLAPDGKGWEAFLHKKREDEARGVFDSAKMFWLSFVGLSLLLSILLSHSVAA